MGKESLNSYPRLKLTEINPFSPRQRQIITLLVDGKSPKEIAHTLGNAYFTVRNIIFEYPYGIFSKVENLTGERPKTRSRLLATLLGDVLVLRRDGDGTEKFITR